MLNSQDIEAVYRELEKMFVALDPRPELGLGYIRERLTLCRAMQDRAAEIRLKVNRELSDVLERHLIAVQTLQVQTTPEHKVKVQELEVLKQRHAGLAKMVGAQMQVLGRTAMDIRLLADLTKEQMKRGEIKPEEAPSLITTVTPGDLAQARAPAPSTPPVVSSEGLAESPAPPVNLFASLEATRVEPAEGGAVSSEPEGVMSLRRPEPVETVDFTTPVAGLPSQDDRMKLAESQTVSIDELFQEASHGGEPSAPRIF